MTEMELMKKGEVMISITVSRNGRGMKFAFKTHPSVEALFREWGAGGSAPITKWGRGWHSKEVLTAYEMLNATDIHTTPSGVLYSLNRIGRDMWEERTPGVQHLNMSFLRLVGSSEGAGLNFSVEGMFSRDTIQRTADAILAASRHLYVSYLQEVDVTVRVSTEHWQQPKVKE